MQDWFTGEAEFPAKDQYSIHHIFPQSKFQTNIFTQLLVNNDISYAMLFKSSKQKTGWHIIEKKLLKILEQASTQSSDAIKKTEDKITKLEFENTTLSDSEIDNEEELKSNIRKINKNKRESKKLHEEIKKLFRHKSKIDEILQKSRTSHKLPLKSIEDCMEFWYRYSNDIEEAKHHPSNLVVIKKNTNSALGGKMLPQTTLKGISITQIELRSNLFLEGFQLIQPR